MNKLKQVFVDENYKDRLQKAEEEEIHARRIGEVVQCMKRFFSNKSYYKSYQDPKNPNKTLNDIPQNILISPTNINIILETQDFNTALEIAQEAIAELTKKNIQLAKSGEITDEKETKLFLNIISEFRSLEIPFHYQGGMMLLYLWLCEGVEFK